MYIALIIIVIILFWTIVIYNRLVRSKELVKEGWSGIDVQLRRRHNLIPRLVDTVKGYMKHEKDVLERVTKLRARAEQTQDEDGVETRNKPEAELTNALEKLFIVVENYPELKASRSFLDLQEALAEVEDELQMARRYYNGAVRNLNILVQSFPSNAVAGVGGFREAQYFELADITQRIAPKVEIAPKTGTAEE